MRWSYKVATLFRIPVRVHISLLLFLGLLALTGGGLRGLILMAAVFGSVVLHELGHALIARSKGLPIVDISLYPFGGMARMAGAPKTTGDEIAVAAAGPIVSFILGLGFWWLSIVSGNAELWLLAKVNLILGGFNLLPALPMDGGRILRALLARKQGFFKATRNAARLARWLAFGMAVTGIIYSFWLIVIAAFLMVMSVAEEAMARARQYMGDPGYQDAPGQHGPPFDPFSKGGDTGSTRVPGTEWEVLDPAEPGPKAPSDRSGRSNRRTYQDSDSNRVVFEWWKN